MELVMQELANNGTLSVIIFAFAALGLWGATRAKLGVMVFSIAVMFATLGLKTGLQL